MIEVLEKPIIKGKSLLCLPSNYTIIDLETTGLDSEFDEIIEISALKIKNDCVIDEYSTLIKPNFPINTFITELTGITNEMVENAPTIEQEIKRLINFIGNDILIGHNINFDINFICNNYNKIEKDNFINDYVDTLRLARRILSDLHHHRLIDLVKYYEIKSDGFHRSSKDCKNTLEVYLHLKQDILKKFDSEDNFIAEMKKSSILKASNISTFNKDFDITHPLYNKKCVFTGSLEIMQRKEAMQKVVDIGGLVQDNINKETNYLIVGSLDYSSNVRDNKSSKMKKAESMKLKGLDIEIISENVFYEMLNINYDVENKMHAHKKSADEIPLILDIDYKNLEDKQYNEHNIEYDKSNDTYNFIIWDENWEEIKLGHIDKQYNELVKEIIKTKGLKKMKLLIKNKQLFIKI